MFRCVQTTNKKKEMSVFVRHVWSSSSPHLWDLAGGRNLSSSFATGIVVIVVHVPVTQHHTTQLVVTNCTLLNTTTKSHRTSRSKTWLYHKTTNTWTNNRRRNLSICIINLFTFIRHRLVFDLTIVAVSVLHISRLWSLDYRRHSGTLRSYLLRVVRPSSISAVCDPLITGVIRGRYVPIYCAALNWSHWDSELVPGYACTSLTTQWLL